MIKTAMILAAGEGRRMRPLTLTQPKPLLTVGARRLIEWHLLKLKQAGIERVVINVAYLGEKIIAFLGTGETYGLQLIYSKEPEPLETGGAINHALPLLGDECFLMVNGDVWIDLDFTEILGQSTETMHLLMVANPAHNPDGDFSLQHEKVVPRLPQRGVTYSGVSVINPSVIASYPRRRDKFPLREVYDWLIDKQLLTGQYYPGLWMDIGTPERLQSLRHYLTEKDQQSY